MTTLRDVSLLPRHLWHAFLFFMASVALWFSWLALTELFTYSVLTAHTPAQSIQWSVVEVSDERYLLRGTYVFFVGEAQYSGATTLQQRYRNAWAASKDIPEHESQRWEVWYSPTHLTYSSLQKNFPFKECISALVLWGIVVYFIILKNRILA